MISPWPWGNSPMEPNINRCHHVYLAWVSRCFDLAMTLRWPYHDLGITDSPMKPSTYPCHHEYSAYLFLYHLKGQGYHISMTSGDFVHAWKICTPPESNVVHNTVKKIWSSKIPSGGYRWAQGLLALCLIQQGLAPLTLPTVDTATSHVKICRWLTSYVPALNFKYCSKLSVSCMMTIFFNFKQIYFLL